ncbi:Alpha-1A adrenergic receptor [Halotydeus destructor]|nr:Alpha-1A adrenergic receptor [Halotydeus destructor]
MDESKPSFVEMMLTAVLLGLVASFVLIGNIAVILCVFLKPTLVERISVRFIISLSVADLIVGAIMILSLIYDIVGHTWTYGRLTCKILNAVDIFGTTSSLMHVYLIGWDSYWAITSPLTYLLNMNSHRAAKTISYVWILSAIFVNLWWSLYSPEFTEQSCSFFNKNEGFVMVTSIFAFYGPLMLMLYLSFRIYKVAVNYSSRANGAQAVVMALEPTGSVRVDVIWTKVLETESEIQPRVPGRKAMVRLSFILGVFILCWFPFFTLYTVLKFCNTCFGDVELLKSVIAWLAWLNSGWNPLIYACSRSDFRRAVASKFHKCVGTVEV